MSDCDQHQLRLMLYVDDELDADELRVIETHLVGCGRCRAVYNREKRFLKSVQRARPLYAASPAIRARVEAALSDAMREKDAAEADEPRPDAASADERSEWAGAYRAAAVVAVFVLFAAGIWGSVKLISPAQATTFAATAVDTHQRHLDGNLPLEVSTDAPAEISRWFIDKVPFAFQLPNFQESSGQDKRYRLAGARLVGFAGDYAAFVAYRMEEHPISLLVTSTSTATPEGGDKISAKGIDFYYDTIKGLKVITWSHRDLTYALVSDLDERGQQSCMVCHQGTKDRDFINSLTMWDGLELLVSDAAADTGSPADR